MKIDESSAVFYDEHFKWDRSLGNSDGCGLEHSGKAL